MKITLGTHTVVEQVGQQMFLLDSQDKQVYSLPREAITAYTPATRSMTVTDAISHEVETLISAGVATVTPAVVSRRAVLHTTGMVAGGALFALTLPTAAAASSPLNGGNGDGDGCGVLPGVTVFGTWSFPSEVDDREIDADITLSSVVFAALSKNLEEWFLVLNGTTVPIADEEGEFFSEDEDDPLVGNVLVLRDAPFAAGTELDVIRGQFFTCPLPPIGSLTVTGQLSDGCVAVNVELTFDAGLYADRDDC